MEIGKSYRVSASTPSSSSGLPGVSDPSAALGCTASTFGKGLQPHARDRTGLYTAKSNPIRKAAVVNRELSSGPAGMPNGRFTGKPSTVAGSVGVACVAAVSSVVGADSEVAAESIVPLLDAAASPFSTEASPASACANWPNGPRR